MNIVVVCVMDMVVEIVGGGSGFEDGEIVVNGEVDGDRVGFGV